MDGSTQSLESKKYSFKVDGTTPVLDFEITAGKNVMDEKRKEPTSNQHLIIELYNPLSREIFEAKFARGRIEVDADGSITYFSSSAEALNVSLFLGHNLQIAMNRRTGEVNMRTPSKIVSVEEDIRSSKKYSKTVVANDSIKIKLE